MIKRWQLSENAKLNALSEVKRRYHRKPCHSGVKVENTVGNLTHRIWHHINDQLQDPEVKGKMYSVHSPGRNDLDEYFP